MPASQMAPQSQSNSEIVLNMVDALNIGDVEASLAYFADDALVYLMGFPPTGIEVYRGHEQIGSLWQDSVDNHFKWETEVISAPGDIVNVRAKTWHDFTSQLGVAPLEYMDVYELKDGKIVTYGSWLTEESLDRFKPAFFAVVPPEPTGTPPSSPPVSEMVVTIAGGTCSTDDPIALQAGEVTVIFNVEDQDNDAYALTMFNLDEDKDILDLMVSTAGEPPSWAYFLLYEELSPGQRETYSFTLEKGPVYLICWSKPPDLPIGNTMPIPVVP
jgi:ketosteroid isomerase-like protein